MHSNTHPNQVRSACQRCRRQKLRCTRQPDQPHENDSNANLAACARCHRLGYDCVTEAQGRVGRPLKRRTAVPAGGRCDKPSPSASSSSSTPLLPKDLDLNAYDETTSSPETIADVAPATFLDWPMDTFGSESPFSLSLDESPSLLPLVEPTVYPEFAMPKPDYPPVPPARNSYFGALSQINVKLYSAFTTIKEKVSSGSPTALLDLACSTVGNVPCPMRVLQSVLEESQTYLSILKTLRGTMVQEALQLEFTNVQAASQQTDQDASGLDSPTAMLVVSCFVQLSKTFETIYNTLVTHLKIPGSQILGGTGISFAGVDLKSFSTTANAYIGMSQHLFRQMMIILGLPGASSLPLQALWKGLLTDERHRAMINAELGSVEGQWSAQPNRVIGLMEASKDMLLFYDMSSFDHGH